MLKKAFALSHGVSEEIECQLTNILENVNDLIARGFHPQEIRSIVLLVPGDNVRNLKKSA